jgi:mRNA interferase RelE/StbE
LVWQIEFGEDAKKNLEKLDKQVAKRIIDFLKNRVAKSEDPRIIGEALKGSKLGEFWKYRVGDYRIVCNIEDEQVRVLVVRIGNRKEIYRK